MKTSVVAIALCSLALSGCADNRLNGGASSDAVARKAKPPPSQTANRDVPEYVYRGGRDPVTGQADIRN